MSRILGLDIGDVRVGVALSDASGTLATPFATFERGGGAAESEILALISREGITTVVAGLPLSEAGAETEQSSKIRSFCRRLERRAKIEITLVDEYLSTVEAWEIVAESKKSRSHKKGKIDAVSAALILQTYLDS